MVNNFNGNKKMKFLFDSNCIYIGHYYDSIINITNNRLTSFEEDVYFSVLTEMYESFSNNGRLNVSLSE